MDGWIKLHRQIQENPLWTCEPFTRGQAWIDLLLLANHKDSFFYKRNIKISVNRGQVGRSEVELSDRWKWSRSKVRKFINDLEKEQQIIQHKTNVTQLITIVNYDEYQKKEQQDEQQKDIKKTPIEQQQDTYKKEKKEEKEKNVNKYADFVLLQPKEYEKLISDHGKDNTRLFIEILDNYKGATGKKYKSDYRAILNWVIDKVKKEDKYKRKRPPLAV